VPPERILPLLLLLLLLELLLLRTELVEEFADERLADDERLLLLLLREELRPPLLPDLFAVPLLRLPEEELLELYDEEVPRPPLFAKELRPCEL
jgi:hypothetical protein